MPSKRRYAKGSRPTGADDGLPDAKEGRHHGSRHPLPRGETPLVTEAATSAVRDLHIGVPVIVAAIQDLAVGMKNHGATMEEAARASERLARTFALARFRFLRLRAETNPFPFLYGRARRLWRRQGARKQHGRPRMRWIGQRIVRADGRG